jgi:hypothetical protein
MASGISAAEKQSNPNVGYGHGMGFKGVKNAEGFVLSNKSSSFKSNDMSNRNCAKDTKDFLKRS